MLKRIAYSFTALTLVVFFMLCVLVIPLFARPAESTIPSMRVGFFIIAPHVYLEENTLSPKGPAAEHVKKAALAMNVSIQWIGPLPLTRLQKMLSDGELDASLMINRNKDREQFLFFPQREITSVQSVFMVREHSPLNKISSIADVKHYRVGFISSANETPFLRDNKAFLHIEYVTGSGWNEQNIQKLLSNRIDAVYDLNEYSLLYQATLMGVRDKVKVINLPEPPGKVYVVFSKKSAYGSYFYQRYSNARFSFDYKEQIAKEFSYLAF